MEEKWKMGAGGDYESVSKGVGDEEGREGEGSEEGGREGREGGGREGGARWGEGREERGARRQGGTAVGHKILVLSASSRHSCEIGSMSLGMSGDEGLESPFRRADGPRARRLNRRVEPGPGTSR
eukprot:762521-Hanusia_phi.AAC.24